MKVTMPRGFEIHPLAAMLPRLGGAEFNELVEDIRQHGMLEPVVLYEGKILDGRNRALASEVLNIELPTTEFSEEKYGCTAEEFVISMNLIRRHLTASQKASLAHEFMERMRRRKPRFKELPRQSEGGWEDITDGDAPQTRQDRPTGVLTAGGLRERPVRSRTAAAAKFGVSEGMIDAAKRVKERSKKQFERVKAGKVSVQQALEKAERGSETFTRALARIERWLGEKARILFENRKSKEAEMYGDLSEEEMRKLWPLIESGEPVKEALKYRQGDLTPAHTIKDLIMQARLNGGSVLVGEFTIWVAHERDLDPRAENNPK